MITPKEAGRLLVSRLGERAGAGGGQGGTPAAARRAVVPTALVHYG
ncbi:hypothetical protein [Streptomyces sp. NPDC102360]